MGDGRSAPGRAGGGACPRTMATSDKMLCPRKNQIVDFGIHTFLEINWGAAGGSSLVGHRVAGRPGCGLSPAVIAPRRAFKLSLATGYTVPQ